VTGSNTLLFPNFFSAPTTNSVLSCRCGVIVGSHARLHEHVLYEHSYPISLPCSLCCASDELIRQKHICNLCNVFADDLEEHLKMHYQDRTSSGALMECRMCFKNFLTVQEVILHERVSHEKLRGPPPTFQCEYCGEVFPTRHLRDNHLLSHFEGGVSEFWDRVQYMQNKMADAIVVNQCPICLSIMGSRKGFRLHIIQKHLLKEPEAFLGQCFGFAIKCLLQLHLCSSICVTTILLCICAKNNNLVEFSY
ncbi:hypothetical protein GCK32_008665, partial [Trichostrongylus colubriformis]